MSDALDGSEIIVAEVKGEPPEWIDVQTNKHIELWNESYFISDLDREWDMGKSHHSSVAIRSKHNTTNGWGSASTMVIKSCKYD